MLQVFSCGFIVNLFNLFKEMEQSVGHVWVFSYYPDSTYKEQLLTKITEAQPPNFKGEIFAIQINEKKTYKDVPLPFEYTSGSTYITIGDAQIGPYTIEVACGQNGKPIDYNEFVRLT